jgi:hypothetical protein
MPVDSAFWLDFEKQFRTLADSFGDLDAICDGTNWHFRGGPSEDAKRTRLQNRFRSLAELAAKAAGKPNRANALSPWLNQLRQHSLKFELILNAGESNGAGAIRDLCLASAEHCLALAAQAFELDAAVRLRDSPALKRRKTYKTSMGSNIDRLRKECGWGMDELANKTGLDKKLILGHINKGKGAYPNTLRIYADAFTGKLNRTVTVAELEG